MLLERIVQRIETQFCVKFMTGIVIVRQQMGGKGGFVRLPQEAASSYMPAEAIRWASSSLVSSAAFRWP